MPPPRETLNEHSSICTLQRKRDCQSRGRRRRQEKKEGKVDNQYIYCTS
jgi:hypothetical protein